MEPSQKLLDTHKRVAEELGFPIGKRRKGDTTSVGSEKIEEKKSRVDDNEAAGRDESRDRSRGSRHTSSREKEERKSRDERRSKERNRRSNDRRR